MKFLLWEIKIEPYRLAKIQWMLFKIFGYRPKKNPCGCTKSANGYYCHQPLNMKYCDIINDGDIHKVVCKCCGHSQKAMDEGYCVVMCNKITFKDNTEVLEYIVEKEE